MIKKLKEKLVSNFYSKDKNEKNNIKTKVIRWLCGIVTTLTLVYILLPNYYPLQKEYHIGDTVTRDIHADRNFPIQDEIQTERQKELAVDSVNPIFDIDVEVINKIQLRISTFFDKIKNIHEANSQLPKSLKDINKNSSISKIIDKIKDDYYITSNNEVFYELLKYAYRDDNYESFDSIKNNTIIIVKEVMQKGILLNKEFFQEGLKSKVEIYYPDNDKAVEKAISEVLDEKEARTVIKNDIINIINDNEKANLVYELSILFIKPNLSYNINKTKLRKIQSSNSIKPIFTIIKKGEIIARTGDVINDNQYKKIKALVEYTQKISVVSILSRVIMVFIFITVSYFYLSRQYPSVLFNDAFLVLITLVFNSSLILQKIIFDMKLSTYFIPIIFISMLFSVLINPRVAFFFTGITAFIVGILMDDSLSSAIIFFTSGTAGIISMTHVRNRISISMASIYISIISALSILSINLYETAFISLVPFNNFFDFIWGFANGIAAASLTGILLPVLESTFNITTDIKLLELSDLNHPILKKLSIEAPGTYHHSIVVGNMAEQASIKIGANALLSRVSSYYHDIGKINKAEYFIENHYDSKHENLSTTLSTLILTSHIKDGLELAKEYKLPKAIVDIIQEHHGTSLMQYFYQRALSEEDEDKTGEIKEYEFRYDGPKPQTKEAAIVMIADSIEAASRVIKDPNPSRVSALIKKIINDKLADGQFEECDITLKDLKNIADEFERIIISMFHRRVEYPDNNNGYNKS